MENEGSCAGTEVPAYLKTHVPGLKFGPNLKTAVPGLKFRPKLKTAVPGLKSGPIKSGFSAPNEAAATLKKNCG